MKIIVIGGGAAGFFAAIMAWGQRKTIIRSAQKLMLLMDDAPFDFITQQSSFTKLMEGNYDNRINNSQQNTNGRGNRPDPALEQALRLAGLDGTPGAARN